MGANSSLRLIQIARPRGWGQTIRERDQGWHLGDLVGRRVMGRMVMYPSASSGRPAEPLCLELYRHGEAGTDQPYAEAGYWLDVVTSLADWWREHALDDRCGGYYTNIAQDGRPVAGPEGHDKWGYVVSRTLYSQCAAFALSGRREFLEAAQSGVEFLCRHAAFERNGHLLFHTRLDRRGVPHPRRPALVNIFTQIYTLTGLAAYYEVTRCPRVARVIDANLRSLVVLFHDDEHGGFFDAIREDNLLVEPGFTDSKSFNSIVDPLSAVLYFLVGAGFPARHAALVPTIRELCALIIRHFVDEEHCFIREMFRRDWRYDVPTWRNPYNTPFVAGNVGGNMKTIWVLLRAWDVLDAAVRAAAERAITHIHRSVVASGAWDALRGGWFDVLERQTPPGQSARHLWHTNKVWWQQEEGILAALLSHLLWRCPEHWELALRGMEFYLTCFVDWTRGGVHDTVSMDGLPVNPQKGCWLKGGYHETELARFAHVYLSVLQDRPVTLHYHVGSHTARDQYRSVPGRIPGATWQVVDERLTRDDVLRVTYRHQWSQGSSAGGKT